MSSNAKCYCDACYELFPERCKEIGVGVLKFSKMKYSDGTIGFLCRQHTYEKAEALRAEGFKVDTVLTPNFMDKHLAFDMAPNRTDYLKYCNEFIPDLAL